MTGAAVEDFTYGCIVIEHDHVGGVMDTDEVADRCVVVEDHRRLALADLKTIIKTLQVRVFLVIRPKNFDRIKYFQHVYVLNVATVLVDEIRYNRYPHQQYSGNSDQY
jgi:predicted ABC-class ATPase